MDCNARPRGLCQALSNRLTAFDNSWALQFVRSNFEILSGALERGAAGCPSDWQRSAIPIFISSFVENREKMGKPVCPPARDFASIENHGRPHPNVLGSARSADADTAPATVGRQTGSIVLFLWRSNRSGGPEWDRCQSCSTQQGANRVSPISDISRSATRPKAALMPIMGAKEPTPIDRSHIARFDLAPPRHGTRYGGWAHCRRTVPQLPGLSPHFRG